MLYFNDDKMNNMLQYVNKNIMEMNSMEDGYLNKMSSISNSGLYGNGIQMIDSQVVSIRDGLSDFRDITRNNIEAMVNLEKKLHREVGGIPLPHDFDASDVGLDLDIRETSLDKGDGRSVNEGVQSTQSDYSDDYKTNSDQIYQLHEEEVTDKELEDYHDINEDELYKMEAEDLQEQNLNDYNQTDKVVIQETNKNINPNKVDFDDNYTVELQDIGNIGEGEENGN